MNTVKSATLGSLAMAKDVVSPEHLHANLVAAAEKGKELVEAVPEAAEHVSRPSPPPTLLLVINSCVCIISNAYF